ncbi:4'-phosphopantetheinyl transferase [Escherichia sp. E10V10]|uniref:restriction endonuclease subunit S n=1 Tax=Escherichia sp. E10V10 TaxID=2478970 RepID=UPI001029EB4C|nr:restriction endonuclease subunit S [Escherichia sp. E10V10]RZN53830.1 4'-phosphopantetheinyl transferase [Escherichia sp. E10V10]
MSAGKLPEGWVETNLQNVASWGSGGTPSRNHDEYYNGNIPWIKTGDLGPKIITNASEYITDAGVKNSSAKFFPKGSVAIAMYGATIGKTSILGIDATTNQACAVGTPLEGVTSTLFLYYFLLNEKNAFIKKGKGGAQPNISQTVIKEHIIYLPPLAEQKIITEKLDTLLAQVESTKARLEQIPQILKRFRQAVLAAAMGGKFTTNAGITQSPLTIGYETSKTPPGWKWYKLIKLAQLESGHTPRKTVPEYWENGDVPWISLQDIRAAHGKKIYKTKFMPTQKGIDNSSARLLPEGTVCFSRDISVGYVTIMGKRMATTQHFANWICGNELKNKYLMFAFMAAKQHLTNSGQGTTVKTIYMPALKELMILIPSLSEQAEIVRRVEQLFAYADTIEKQVNNALARVNNLTQSILAKAFRGELTAQWRAENPELISGENSAAALLEKIKAERAASGGKKASRKKS